MLAAKRAVPLLALIIFFAFLLLLRDIGGRGSWDEIAQTVGQGDHAPDARPPPSRPSSPPKSHPHKDHDSANLDPRPLFKPGDAKPPGSNYTRTLVMPKMQEEDVSWIHDELLDIDAAVYVADDPYAPLHPPKNKGHEAMVYLSYIIDHYEKLPDIVIFMHSHRWAWHNDDVVDWDAVQMLQSLSSERIMREGYMNLRCNWAPGCPDWMHPGTIDEDINKQEEVMIAMSWGEIFPNDPIPQVLAQPCCAQFAVSRDRVLAVPKSRYIFYRDWLLRTELSDYISGRVWEYLWHVVFTGDSVFCPKQNICYCDGYGICFGGGEQLDAFYGLRFQLTELEAELKRWDEKAKAIETANREGRLEEAAKLEVPKVGRDTIVMREINDHVRQIDKLKAEALERGKDPKNRALEAGRKWMEGDGF
jgi:hypothetical protein